MGFQCYKVKGLFSNMSNIRYPQTQLVFSTLKTSGFIYLNNKYDILNYLVFLCETKQYRSHNSFSYHFRSHDYVYFGFEHILDLKSSLKNLVFLIFIEVASFHIHISDSY